MTPEPRYALTFPGLPVTVDLSAEEVRRYLEAMGWAEDTSDVLRGTWRRFRAAWGPVYVPALDGAADFAVRLREAIELIGRAENRPALDVARDIIARRPGAAPVAEHIVCGKHDTATGSAIGWQVWCPGCNPTLHRAPVAELDLDAIDARSNGASWRPDAAALVAEVRRLRATNTALHRRAQKAEGLLSRCEAPQKARKRGSGSLGRAAANYAAAQAERKLDAYRAWAKAFVALMAAPMDDAAAAEAERAARAAAAAADPEHAAGLVEGEGGDGT